MKPDWDTLMEEYKDSPTVVIAEVDCTGGGKAKCGEADISGFPTVKHGDPDALEEYEGSRELKAMRKFVKEHLRPRCTPSSLDLCSPDQQKMIDGFKSISAADLKALIDEKDEAVADSEQVLEELLQALQKQYEEAAKRRDETKQGMKDAGLFLMKSVLAQKLKSPTKAEL
eukprot:UN1209